MKMILKPTNGNNGIEYLERPQNERVKKILKKDSKERRKQNNQAENTLTQIVKRKEKVSHKESNDVSIL